MTPCFMMIIQLFSTFHLQNIINFFSKVPVILPLPPRGFDPNVSARNVLAPGVVRQRKVPQKFDPSFK